MSGNLVEVDIMELTVKFSMLWCWDLPQQHRTGADDGEGNIPEADTGNV